MRKFLGEASESADTSINHTENQAASMDLLKKAITDAIALYQRENPRRARSEERLEDISNISRILAECTEPSSEKDLINRLGAYFSSNNYHTGFRDHSALERLLVEAIHHFFQSRDLSHPVFNFYPIHKKDALIKTLTSPSDSSNPEFQDICIPLSYQLKDFLDLAFDLYEEEVGVLSEERQQNKKEILITILKPLTDRLEGKTHPDLPYCDPSDIARGLMFEIRQYIARKLSFNNRLKRYLRQALENFEFGVKNRKVYVRRWESTPAPERHPRVTLLFLHGWRDCVETANALGSLAIQSPFHFRVVAYDQRGFGWDEQRNEFGVSVDLLRLDFRLFLTNLSKKYPGESIVLIGHSLGASILIAEQPFITRNHQVKQVILIAPAIMGGSGVFNILSYMLKQVPRFLSHRTVPHRVRSTHEASLRWGGWGPSPAGLLHFMSRVSPRFFSMETTSGPKYKVYAGEQDIPIDSKDCGRFSAPGAVHFFKRADHGIPYSHYATIYLRKILEDSQRDLITSEPSLCARPCA